MRVPPAGLERSRREVGPVRRVGEVLGFQTERLPATVSATAAAADPVVEKVPGVELEPGLSGRELEHATAFGLDDSRCRSGLAVAPAVAHHQAVVVAASLRYQGFDAGPHITGTAKIEGCARHRSDLAGGKTGLVDRQIGVRLDLETM